MQAKLRFDRIDDIFAYGLHEYLTDFIDQVIVLGDAISRDFMLVE